MALFILILLSDLIKLDVESTVVARNTIDLGKCIYGLLYLAVTVIVSRTFWEERHAEAENQGPEVCDTHWNTPRAGVDIGFGSKIDAVGNEDTKRDEQLIGTGDSQKSFYAMSLVNIPNERSSNMTRSRLGLIHGNQQRNSTHAKSSDPTAYGDLVPLSIGRGDLNGDPNAHHPTPATNAPFSSHAIGNWGSDQSSHQCTNRQL